MKTAIVRVIQQRLIKEGLNPGTVDGLLGYNTYRAVNDALTRRKAGLPGDWPAWSNTRKTVAYLQLLCKELQIEVGDIDGYWGPQTDYAFETMVHILEYGQAPRPWRDETPLDINPHDWPLQDETELTKFYGKVGTNQVSLSLPYPHRLAWELKTVISSYQCNARVHDSIERVLQRVFDHYGMERIKELRLDRWGGCLNVRKMRGGSNWSTHSWGIAIDYDPDNNQLKWGRDKAAFARQEYEAWWRFWEEEGWSSLGRTRNYDWMHVQAAKL
ncbi:MAG: M15 family metallopeptidase [Geobacteraceae bacterium]|nr:M15 family metallopeptidase [Geobacteraceae bacterium]